MAIFGKNILLNHTPSDLPSLFLCPEHRPFKAEVSKKRNPHWRLSPESDVQAQTSQNNPQKKTLSASKVKLSSMPSLKSLAYLDLKVASMSHRTR